MILETTLNERSQDILNNIVDIYTASGVPVGSTALVKATGSKLSSATIRNVMADLEKKGYLASPHTSAGRVPTEEGFRFYAQSLVGVSELSEDIKEQVKKIVDSDKKFEEILNDVSRVLGEMTNCAGMVSSHKRSEDPLEHVEFIRLSDDKVLAVMVTLSGHIENRIIAVPDHIEEDVLNGAAKQLRSIVHGQTLADARVSMMQALTEQKFEVDSMMTNMLASADLWAEPKTNDGALVVNGSTNLFQYPELVRDKLKSLIQTFEEKRLLMALMDEVQKGDGVQIFIGKECPIEAATDCALITSKYGTGAEDIVGTLGVIGPMRMNYKHTIQLVDYTAKLLSQALQRRAIKKA